MMIADWRDFDARYDALLVRLRRGERAASPFSFLTLSDSPADQHTAAKTWADFIRIKPTLPNITPSRGEPKIKIGYYSADFHNHAMMVLMAGLFEQHDKNRFELFGFWHGRDLINDTHRRVAMAFDRFIDVRKETDTGIAALSRSLQIDIAVDLSGFTQLNRPNIFAQRAAPLQVNYLGYPGTMGAAYMDYMIADHILIRENAREHYAENIVYMPYSYQVNDRARRIAENKFNRADLGLPEQAFVFCCLNNNYKIHPAIFDNWMRILKRTPSSVLWLLEDNAAAAENLRREATQRGIDDKRLVFCGRISPTAHLARHRAADLFLDTLPYNAHTTASDALWAGLPVLTRIGESMAGRVAASLLNAIQMPELNTTTAEEYENLAVALATDADRMRRIRDKLERNRLTTPLFDTT